MLNVCGRDPHFTMWGPGNCVVHSACVKSKEVLSYSAYFYSFLLNAFLQSVRY